MGWVGCSRGGFRLGLGATEGDNGVMRGVMGLMNNAEA